MKAALLFTDLQFIKVQDRKGVSVIFFTLVKLSKRLLFTYDGRCTEVLDTILTYINLVCC